MTPTTTETACPTRCRVADADSVRSLNNTAQIPFTSISEALELNPPCSAPGDCNVLADSGRGQFFDAGGVVVDGQDNLYVADTGNHRAQRRVVIEVANPPAAGADASGD